MKTRCPHVSCSQDQNLSPNPCQVVRNGSYFRKSDSRYVPQYFCKSCKIHFSQMTKKASIHQKKRRITHPLYELLNSGVSQRRAATILGVNRKTVVRRFKFLSETKFKESVKDLKNEYRSKKLSYVQFDDLETAEHTKCKPLSVALAIDPKTRKILSFQVNQMPAKGPLAKTAYQKYGKRKDERKLGWEKLMEELKPYVLENATFHSDENPHYVGMIKKYFPKGTHLRVKGGRGAIAGQGELKKLRYDPLFSLNHTCAMLRANLNRLFRRTWCISKTIEGLRRHLAIYMSYHNSLLTPSSSGELGAS